MTNQNNINPVMEHNAYLTMQRCQMKLRAGRKTKREISSNFCFQRQNQKTGIISQNVVKGV